MQHQALVDGKHRGPGLGRVGEEDTKSTAPDTRDLGLLRPHLRHEGREDRRTGADGQGRRAVSDKSEGLIQYCSWKEYIPQRPARDFHRHLTCDDGQ
jgi:hypothetical protein